MKYENQLRRYLCGLDLGWNDMDYDGLANALVSDMHWKIHLVIGLMEEQGDQGSLQTTGHVVKGGRNFDVLKEVVRSYSHRQVIR